ncbi:ATP-binding protein [Kribbella turkmenica]|uniref:ATP-binding protein n=1 Tax=Kribbella turkmenica TaxID=2530375 RepID=A0A4R4XG41_9ACTN|nr:ATP-binding protein [Kribbella turkmenica]TDD29773.1 ATP-binding protein [Kribbella turkmenica]
MFLLQMSGVPGSGKSTVAAHVVDNFGAVAVDYDVIKSAVLDAGVDLAGSAKAAYEVMYALARQILGQGRPVVMDSPCFWPRILNEGMEIARAYDASYRYIECRIHDLGLLDERLAHRPRLRTHRRSVNLPPPDLGDQPTDGEALYREAWDSIQRPADNYLQLDMHRPLTELLPEVNAYLRAPRGAGSRTPRTPTVSLSQV